jgi:hypothetical protein
MRQKISCMFILECWFAAFVLRYQRYTKYTRTNTRGDFDSRNDRRNDIEQSFILLLFTA